MMILAQIGEATQAINTYSNLDRVEQLLVILIIILMIALFFVRSRSRSDALTADAEDKRAEALNKLVSNQTTLIERLDEERREGQARTEAEQARTETVIQNNTTALEKVSEMIASLKFSIKGVTDMQEQATENIIQLQGSIEQLQKLNSELAELLKRTMPGLNAMPGDHERTYKLLVELADKFDKLLAELHANKPAALPLPEPSPDGQAPATKTDTP